MSSNQTPNLTRAQSNLYASTILERMHEVTQVAEEEIFSGSTDARVIGAGSYGMTHGIMRRPFFSKDHITIEIASIGVAHWSSEPITEASTGSTKRIVQLLSRPETIEEVIRNLRHFGHDRYADRIDFLHKYDDFDDGEKPLSFESAITFLSFITNEIFSSEFKNLGEPLIGLFSEGTLSAEWKLKNRHLLIEFHADDVASFAMIDGEARLNGRNCSRCIVSTLMSQSVPEWGNK
ncbi:MAG: hypothetical protein OXF52_03840 [Candidatus Dadabacteria bacterium]|nr:hypothetical protein [Candidatus Dadabacteria bacterium]